MRELIRPALLITARTGLFLSVVAWAVSGQFRVVIETRAIGVALAEEGLAVAVADLGSLQTTIEPAHGASPLDYFFEYPSDESKIFGVTTGFSACGLTVGAGVAIALVGIRYWLVVSFFTVFNIVLHGIYCRRREVSPCEN